MTRTQLDWFLNGLWRAGVAYGRLIPGGTVHLTEDELFRIREEIAVQIRAGLPLESSQDTEPIPVPVIVQQVAARIFERRAEG